MARILPVCSQVKNPLFGQDSPGTRSACLGKAQWHFCLRAGGRLTMSCCVQPKEEERFFPFSGAEAFRNSIANDQRKIIMGEYFQGDNKFVASDGREKRCDSFELDYYYLETLNSTMIVEVSLKKNRYGYYEWITIYFQGDKFDHKKFRQVYGKIRGNVKMKLGQLNND